MDNAIHTFENHAQDSRVQDIGAVSPLLGASNANSAGVSGNNPLVVFSKASHARNSAGDGERYEKSEVAQTRNTFDQGETRAQEVVVSPAVCKTLSAEGFDGMPDIQKGNGMPVVAIDGNKLCKNERAGGSGLGVSTEGVMYTETACDNKHHAVAVRTANTHANGHGVAEEATHTLDRASGKAVAVGVDAYNQTLTGGVSMTNTAKNADPHHVPCVSLNHIVRRLTPVECERLQGFPQDWTKIPWKTYQEANRKGVSYERLLAERGMRLREPTTEECPDSPRYKALGNSWGTNCAEWILRRIVAAFRLDMIPEVSP